MIFSPILYVLVEKLFCSHFLFAHKSDLFSLVNRKQFTSNIFLLKLLVSLIDSRIIFSKLHLYFLHYLSRSRWGFSVPFSGTFSNYFYCEHIPWVMRLAISNISFLTQTLLYVYFYIFSFFSYKILSYSFIDHYFFSLNLCCKYYDIFWASACLSTINNMKVKCYWNKYYDVYIFDLSSSNFMQSRPSVTTTHSNCVQDIFFLQWLLI